MMMVIEMKRSIYNDFIKWKNSSNRKPLMITGVGSAAKLLSFENLPKTNTTIILRSILKKI